METLKRQEIIAQSIEKILVNFKKDSASRKTEDYIKKRLDALHDLWEEFESNHEQLVESELSDVITSEYIVNKAFDKVKLIYDTIFDLLRNHRPRSEERGVPSKTDELLGQQQTNFRAFTRLIKQLDIDKLTEKWEIDDKLHSLQARWKVIDDLHWQIDNLLIGADVDYEQEFSQHESIYENIKKKLNIKLNATVHQYRATPHLEIPTFSGSYAHWPTFMDLYCEAIHNNPSLSKGQKMQHLKGKLRGEAERIIQHLTVSSENYDTCWDILTHRYNNIQLLFTKQIQTFMNQPALQSQSAYELKRLHDTSLETIHAIHNLGVDTTTWDPILVHILTTKLDAETYTSYMEMRKAPRELPVFDEFIGFLEGKFTALEPINKKKQMPSYTTKNMVFKETPSTSKQQQEQIIRRNEFKRFNPKTYHANVTRNCPLCKQNHILIHCKAYQNKTPENKLTTIKELDICKNCLFPHNGMQCNSTKRCKLCNNAHHTLIHDILYDTGKEKSKPIPPISTSRNIEQPTNTELKRNSNHVSGKYNEVLLATFQVKVRAIDGTYITLRCLLDQGSQVNLISESAAQRLGLQRYKQNATVSGIGITNNHSNGTVQLTCQSLLGDYEFTTEALVMSKMLNSLPNYSFEKQQWPHITNITLADPDYNISRPVDILIDASVYADIVMEGILRGPANAPIAQQTKLGWVLLGNVNTFSCHVVLNNLQDLSQFWEMEEINETRSNLTQEESYCETLYTNTTQRRADGHYEVKIPMKQGYQQNIGASKPQAVAQFLQLEKRFAKNKQFAAHYKDFIDEYVNLGHMKESTEHQEPSCFLPHHGVIKLDSTTTKLRAVFNASCPTKSGYSLNQLMQCGPNLQQDLLSLILRWRTFQYVYTADIEKFYRQIFIQTEDQHLQKILWRASTTELIKEYQLCTVTYGTKAAPFLAMRTIQQLIQDDGHLYPLAAEILKHQLYVDDLLGGSNSIIEAQQTQQSLIELLKRGGFNLRKWASNNGTLLQNLNEEQINQRVLDFKHAESNKTLGITWNPCTVNFTFQQTASLNESDVTTKRKLLSDISKLYDPLGWLAPVTVKAKLIFQKVWASNTDWDEHLPDAIRREWELLQQELALIQHVKIPRWIGNTEKPIELHGFCDASERAYGCVIYCKSIDENGKSVIKLVTAKTKLTPLKKQISLPRLELCSAELLARLMAKVKESINKQRVSIYRWSDSMVVLGWLQGEPSRWKTFVANRVSNITAAMPPSCWRHVRSEDNPADCASRGLSPSQLLSHPAWWEGPSWLKNNNIHHQEAYDTNEEEKKLKQICTSQQTSPLITSLLQQYSSMSRVIRVLSWITRFIKNARNVNKAKRMPYLTTTEIESAHDSVIKTVQHIHFEDDIQHLQKHNKVRATSKILSLNPTLDKNCVLRVGGRLEHANLRPSQKHPIILPKADKITELLIDQAHKTTLHGGARLTLSYLRNRYWILGGMDTVKKHLLKCVRCHRFKTTNNMQLMADLPKPRVTPSRPFTHTGVDFTGQIDVKANKGRGIRTSKGYIAIFICLCTKAIHLELVSDLSTPTFLAALKRLCARRGSPKHMYSDNGTNFVGAAKVLDKERKQALKHYINTEFFDNISQWGIEWHFNAPAWPTAGGLWESAVKSMKHHLRRVIGEQRLTFEEYSTLLAQIEACLNSRPLIAPTSDIEDLECLTPGHFLVGGPVLASPPTVDEDNRSLTTRWLLTERLHRDFWKKWSVDYLQTLQTRELRRPLPEDSKKTKIE